MNSDPTIRASLSRLYAHDFRNPLSAISANLSFLEACLEDADVREAATESSVAVQNLLFLIDNFVLISRLEANEISALENVTFADFVHQSLTRCRKLSILTEAAVNLHSDVPTISCSWPIVYARLALENLLLSSIAHACEPGQVTLTCNVDKDMAIMTVTDNGPPMGHPYLSCCFDEIFQISAKSVSDARYARGMGMYAIQLAARFLGGAVEALPSGQHSQSFRLFFPIHFNP